MVDTQKNFTGMVSTLFKSGEEMQKELTVVDLELIHSIIGIGGEADEIVSAINNEDDENLVEELGDLEFYLNRVRVLLELEEHNVPNETRLDDRETIASHKREFLAQSKDDLNVLAGQITDLVKKATIYRKALDRAAIENVIVEFDIALECAYRALRVTREEVLRFNIKKLSKRYSKGYSNQAAQERADKK